MKKNILIPAIVLIIASILILLIADQRKGMLEISFTPKEVNFKINNKQYFKINHFKRKLPPGKYKIEVTKEDYETFKEDLSINPRENKKLKISLKIKKETEIAIKTQVLKHLKNQPHLSKIEFKIKIIEIKKDYAKVKVSPSEKVVEDFLVILKKENNTWKVLAEGTDDISPETLNQETLKINLIKKLPYVSEEFDIVYVDHLDQFYVIIKKEPIEKTKEKARKWLDEQGINRKTIKIRWTLSPTLIRSKQK